MIDGRLLFRKLQKDDIEKIVSTFSFPWTTPESTLQKWLNYYEEQERHQRTVCVLEQDASFIGYGSLLYFSKYPPFKSAHIPEIHDVWITEERRGKGFGALLIGHLENLARKENYQTIGIGVGLYQDYGPAQKLYVQLGYRPDGAGITYHGMPVVPGTSYPVDDDLILWLTKRLI